MPRTNAKIKSLAKAVDDMLQGNGSLNNLELALTNLLKVYPNLLQEDNTLDRQETDRDETDRDDPDIHGY